MDSNGDLMSDDKKSPIFGLNSFMLQPLDAEGNPSGPPIFGGKRDLRPKIYYIVNKYVPKRDEKGDVVYFRIPTSVFAMNPAEGSRIISPQEVYVLHPDNFSYLHRAAIAANFQMEEWEWDKTILRPTLIGDEGEIR